MNDGPRLSCAGMVLQQCRLVSASQHFFCVVSVVCLLRCFSRLSLGVRQNGLDAAAWHQVMDGLEAFSSITSLNGLDGVGGLFAGSQTEVQLGGKGLAEKEAVVAVARLLERSRATLTRLDLRCCAGL